MPVDLLVRVVTSKGCSTTVAEGRASEMIEGLGPDKPHGGAEQARDLRVVTARVRCAGLRVGHRMARVPPLPIPSLPASRRTARGRCDLARTATWFCAPFRAPR